MDEDKIISLELSEGKTGTITFASDVIATIAGLAAADVSGVSGMSGGVVKGIAEMLGRKDLTKGVKVEVGMEEAAIDIQVIVQYGYRIQDVASEIQNNVKNAVETMTGLRVVQVNVLVQGVTFEKMPKGKETEA